MYMEKSGSNDFTYNINAPNINSTTIDNKATLTLPVNRVIDPSKIGPITAENFPSILKNPKNSPSLPLGTNLANKLLLIA